MITAREMTDKIGYTADYLTNHLAVRVFIRDARVRFGEIDYLIEPVCGYGEIWVSHYSLKDMRPTPTTEKVEA